MESRRHDRVKHPEHDWSLKVIFVFISLLSIPHQKEWIFHPRVVKRVIPCSLLFINRNVNRSNGLKLNWKFCSTCKPCARLQHRWTLSFYSWTISLQTWWHFFPPHLTRHIMFGMKSSMEFLQTNRVHTRHGDNIQSEISDKVKQC